MSKPFTDLQLRAILQKWSRRDQTNTTPSPIAIPPPKPIGAQPTERLDEALHAVLLRSRPAFLGRLLRTFLSSIPETMLTLRSAVEQADGELLRTLAHSLKSASANVGAKRLSELCRLLDVKLKLGADPAECGGLTDQIETELGLVEDGLQLMLTRLGPQVDQATG